MEIDNKEAYRVELKSVLTERIRQFPIYFYGNIIINIFIMAVVIVSAVIIVAALRFDPAVITFGFLFITALLSALSITMRNFLKNIRILNAIRAGDYDLDIEDYELDNVIEFFEDLPMKKEELEQVKVTLSFEKLINILELFGIIYCEGAVCDVDVIFKCRTKEAIGEEWIK
jgi:hypothetical protein